MSKISVVVPIYNVEKWLRNCLDSILNQSYTNFELILVNDGSPDKCGEISNEYAKNDSRIKVIHKKNGGLSSARNAGIDAACGKYIVFIDSDDQVSNSYLFELHEAAEKNKCDAVICGYQTVPTEKKVMPQFKLNTPMSGRDLILSSTNIHSNNDLCFTPRFMFDLSLMKERKIRFNEKVLVAEDTIFNLEFILESKQVIVIPKALYYYTVNNPDSIMRTPYKSYLESSLVLQYEIKKQISEKFNLLENTTYRKDLANYYMKSIFNMMKNNLINSPEADKVSGILRMINYEMFSDSIKEIGFFYRCNNYKEYIYFLALKFRIMSIIKKEIKTV